MAFNSFQAIVFIAVISASVAPLDAALLWSWSLVAKDDWIQRIKWLQMTSYCYSIRCLCIRFTSYDNMQCKQIQLSVLHSLQSSRINIGSNHAFYLQSLTNAWWSCSKQRATAFMNSDCLSWLFMSHTIIRSYFWRIDMKLGKESRHSEAYSSRSHLISSCPIAPPALFYSKIVEKREGDSNECIRSKFHIRSFWSHLDVFMFVDTMDGRCFERCSCVMCHSTKTLNHRSTGVECTMLVWQSQVKPSHQTVDSLAPDTHTLISDIIDRFVNQSLLTFIYIRWNLWWNSTYRSFSRLTLLIWNEVIISTIHLLRIFSLTEASPMLTLHK